MTVKSKYQQPMQPWPGLETYGKRIHFFDQNLAVFVYEAGKGNPHNLILLHGLGDEADTWRHVIKPLSEEYHVVAADLPGFGRSDLPKEKISPVLLLNLLEAVFQEMRMNNAVLIGNSLGGILAHAYALKHPDQIEGLVLMDGALLQNDPMGDFSLRLMQIPILGEWLYTRLRKDPQAAYDSLRNVYHDLDAMPESDQKFLFRRVNKRVWSDRQRKAYFSVLRNLTPWVRDRQANLPDQLENLETPTLVIRGEFDRLFSEENAKGVARVQPNTAFSTIPGAGHLPQQERPAKLLDDLLEWLEKTLG